MGPGLSLERGAEEVLNVAVLVEGRMCRRRKFPDRANVAVLSLGRQLLLLQLSMLGSPDATLQYPPSHHQASLVFAIGAHLSPAKTADSILVHEQSAERWTRIWVGLRIGSALLGRMTETALAIAALYLCQLGE